jgi:uncharacterized membrane protein
MDTAPPTSQPPRAATTLLQPAVMVHFYRGVMDLATTWRVRIDSTTNWAVISSGSIVSLLLGNPESPHLMALLGMFLAFAFLSIEARRFRFYDLWSGWVRVMETEYYVPLLQQNVIDPDQHWHPLLQSDLESPHFKISWSEAVGRRLRHNYIAIFGFLLMTWIIKLMIHPEAVPVVHVFNSIVERASIAGIPGWVVIACVAAFYLYLVGLIFFTPTLRGTGTEILGRNLLLRRLVNPSARLVGFKRAQPTLVEGRNVGHAPEED